MEAASSGSTMRRHYVLLSVCTCLSLTLVAGPPTATAASPVVADCNTHGTVTGNYSIGELQAALTTLPADVKEYSSCYDAIQRALLAKIAALRSHKTTGASTSSGGSFLPTPLIIVLAVLIAAGAGFGVSALRRRQR
jgi:hypothetical protein